MSEIDTSPEAVAQMLEGVTPEPWAAEANGVYAFDGMRLVASLKEHIGGRDWPTTERDRNFIAWSREAVPALAARIAELAADLAAEQDRSIEEAILEVRAEQAEAREAKLIEAKKAMAQKLAAAEAEVTRLRDALTSISKTTATTNAALNVHDIWKKSEIARAALQETKP